MKILHIISNLDVGGSEISLRQLVLTSKNHNIIISLSDIGAVGDDLQKAGIEVTALNMRGIKDAPAAIFKLVKIIKEKRPDIVQSWLYHADLLGGIAAKIAGGTKIIWGVRSTHVFSGHGTARTTYFAMRACAFLSRYVPDCIVYVAESARASHEEMGYSPKKSLVIGNGYDTGSFGNITKNEARKTLKISDDALVIGSVGRYNEYKDHRNFVLAAAMLAAKFKNIYFLMIGRDVEYKNPELMLLVTQTGFSDRFILLGERNDIPLCLAAMDIYCLHSMSEAFPNVLAEAMCASLPIVTTNVGDAAKLVGDTGIVVHPKNPQALAGGLLTLINETPEQRANTGRRARARIENNYSIATTGSRYEELYKSLLPNIDAATVAGFGDEWKKFDQSQLSPREHEELFNAYFSIFPWHILPRNAIGCDVGCGSGRWAKMVAPRVGILHCIDPSDALEVAKRNLAGNENCLFHRATANSMPIEENSLDFGYSVGVLHHIPDTEAALAACVSKLKSGAPFLVYLYYAFDNRPLWFRAIWLASDALRRIISRLPNKLRYAASQLIATLIYWPMARISILLEKMGINVSNIPLSAYRKRSFYTMRTDALDRFGTRLEQRFTRAQIKEMMKKAGLDRIEFSEYAPYWCAVGYKV